MKAGEFKKPGQAAKDTETLLFTLAPFLGGACHALLPDATSAITAVELRSLHFIGRDILHHKFTLEATDLFALALALAEPLPTPEHADLFSAILCFHFGPPLPPCLVEIRPPLMRPLGPIHHADQIVRCLAAHGFTKTQTPENIAA